MNLLYLKFLHANAVVPIPMNGSQVVMSGYMPWSLMHISGSLTGNGEGWSDLTFGQLQIIDRKIEFSHRPKALSNFAQWYKPKYEWNINTVVKTRSEPMS
jgi:hypothetical protein